MIVGKEEKAFLRGLIEDTRPLCVEALEHLRLTEPEEYDRLHTMAAECGLCP